MTADATAATRTVRVPAPAGERPLLEVNGLQKHFRRSSLFGRGGRSVRAVDGVSLRLERGRTLGLVGESGCGKTTMGRLLVRLEDPTGGEILLDGGDCTAVKGASLRAYRHRVQMVFQDPTASLDPKMQVGASIVEPLAVRREGSQSDRHERVARLMMQVGLATELAKRYPHQLSGGQKQRVGIARALALSPDIIVADEPTSALDVSVRAQVVNLLRDLQREVGVSFVFISHDLSTVRYISDDVAVMYLGKIAERGPAEEIFREPAHPYTKALLAAVPVPDPVRESERESILLEGEVPSPSNPPSGCRFSTRCPLVTARCRDEEPELRSIGGGRDVACHLV